jgi:hypothetical protein
MTDISLCRNSKVKDRGFAMLILQLVIPSTSFTRRVRHICPGFPFSFFIKRNSYNMDNPSTVGDYSPVRRKSGNVAVVRGRWWVLDVG